MYINALSAIKATIESAKSVENLYGFEAQLDRFPMIRSPLRTRRQSGP
jgi:hypothetical protein